ncbi:MAG: L,D-transpeptidase family protein, partial [Microlunatus sp.]|nr:L,D-transpeptidase family protein [Microlunatus sp.]
TPTTRATSRPAKATRPAATRGPSATPKPTPSATPQPAPVVLLRPGTSSPKVRELQARLRQLRWLHGDVTSYYGTNTTSAVLGFQAKRGFVATGTLDERTWNRIVSMSRPPSRDELNNIFPKPVAPKPGKLSWDVDQRCLTGRAICISKSTRMLTWVVDGVPRYQFDVRFGSEALPTREGTFAITWKKKDVISNLYHTPMPYSMFFSGGQAIHYSSNFARLGYNGSSHGCVNVRDWNGIVRLYDEAPVSTKVVVHW